MINHAWLGNQIEAAFGNGRDYGVSIQYSPEVSALETAGGICQALPILNPNDFFLVINGDIFCPNFPIQKLIQCSEQLRTQEQFLAHLILVPNPPHHPTGIGIYHRRLFDGLIRGESAKLAPILRRAMLNNQISGEKYLGSWQDVGSPERLAELNRS
ncbi:MAG: hypothetical protein EBW80_06310 [Burkholderiaceae bacterium]|nr:hypothetical protein [Burkholderiaceae bacterium]